MTRDEKLAFEQLNDRVSSLEKKSSESNRPPEKVGFWAWIQRLVGLFAIVGGLLFFTEKYVVGPWVDGKIDAKANANKSAIDGLKSTVSSLEATLNGLRETLKPFIEERMRRAIAAPLKDLEKLLPDVKRTVDFAREQRIVAPVELMVMLGERALGLSAVQGQEDEVWQTALSVLAYRTIATAPDPSLLKPEEIVPPFGPNIDRSRPEAIGQEAFAAGTYVPTNVGARMGLIGTVDEWGASGSAPSLLVVHGGIVDLDGKHIRSVVYFQVDVRYSGKTAILENVRFVDCTFKFVNADRCRRLARNVLS